MDARGYRLLDKMLWGRQFWWGAGLEPRLRTMFSQGTWVAERKGWLWSPEGGSGVMKCKHPDPRSKLEPASWKEIEKRSAYYGLQQLNTQLGVLKTLACFQTIVLTSSKSLSSLWESLRGISCRLMNLTTTVNTLRPPWSSFLASHLPRCPSASSCCRISPSTKYGGCGPVLSHTGLAVRIFLTRY